MSGMTFLRDVNNNLVKDFNGKLVLVKKQVKREIADDDSQPPPQTPLSKIRRTATTPEPLNDPFVTDEHGKAVLYSTGKVIRLQSVQVKKEANETTVVPLLNSLPPACICNGCIGLLF